MIPEWLCRPPVLMPTSRALQMTESAARAGSFEQLYPSSGGMSWSSWRGSLPQAAIRERLLVADKRRSS